MTIHDDRYLYWQKHQAKSMKKVANLLGIEIGDLKTSIKIAIGIQSL